MISERTILKIIRFGIYAVLFLPLIVLPQFFFPFPTSKGFLFQIIIEIIFALYLAVAIQNPSYRPKKTLLFYTASFYFLAVFLSAVFGVDFYRSFFGNYERMWGFFQLSHFFLFFIILAGVFRSREEWERLVKIALFSGALSVVAGLVQFLSPLISGGGVSRASSITGNPSFFASYLFFPFLFSIFFIRHPERSEGSRKKLYLGLALLSLIAILSTATRGALVGLGAVAISASLIVVFESLFSRTKSSINGPSCHSRESLPAQAGWNPGFIIKSAKIISTVFLIAVVAGATALFAPGSLFKQPERISQEKFFTLEQIDPPAQSTPSKFGSLGRLLNFSFYDTTIQTRLIAWKSSSRSFGDYPFFGVGPENFISAFNKYFNPEFYVYDKYDAWLDRAHNAFIDALVMNGAVGLLAYLFLLGSCFYVAFRFYKEGKLRFRELLIFVLFFIGYATQNLFLFDTFSVFLMFVLAIAFLNSFALDKRPDLPKIVRSAEVGSPKILVSILAIAIVLYFFNLKPIMANYYLAKAESGDYGIDQAMEFYQKSESFNSFGNNEARSRMALAVAREVQTRQNSEVLPANLESYLDQAISATRRNIENSDTHHAIYRLQLADLYNLKLSRDNTAVSSEIEDIVRGAIKNNPGRVELPVALAQAEILKGDLKKSLEILEAEVAEKNPEHPVPHWKISQNYLLLGDIDKAISFFERALWLGARPKNPKEALWAEKYYLDKEDYVKLILVDKILLDFYADNQAEQIRLHINLAIAYAKLGRKNKAIEHAQKVSAIDPAQKETVENFLQELR